MSQISQSKPTPIKASPNALADQPLEMTVHSLPRADAQDNSAAQARSGRWKMLLVMAACATPVIASYFTYYVVRPNTQQNYGELITPVRALPSQQGMGIDGKPVDLRSLKGQWLIVSTAGGACDSACEANLYAQRQLRESLGRDKDRIDWVWLVSDNAPIRAELLPALQSATVLRLPQAQIDAWLSAGQGHARTEHLYLVDPQGNWMLRWPVKLEAGKAKRDMDRLLRAASSWDRAGRE
jgi:hypothetical protein